MVYDTLKIGKEDIKVKLVELKVADLKFYVENPRVYSELKVDDLDPTQEEIERLMCKLDNVKSLKESIQENGGLIDPLIVRDGDLVVLEGNSRLAAYRLLCASNPLEWGMVKCKVLPSDITEDAIFKLLSQYHIVGKKDWDPYEQASYIYRRLNKTRLHIDQIAKDLGFTKTEAQRMVDVVKFMEECGDQNKKHFSHYLEFKKLNLGKYREDNDDMDTTIVEQIKTDKIRDAKDIRKIGKIVKEKDKCSRKIVDKIADGSISVYDGYDEFESLGKTDNVVKKLNDFKAYINRPNFESNLLSSNASDDEIRFTIKKILSALEKVQKKYEK